MGLLDKLWDDTIGGPQPEKGPKKSISVDIAHEDVSSPTSVASSPGGSMSRFPFPFPYSPRSLPSPSEFSSKKVVAVNTNGGEKGLRETSGIRRISRSISIAKGPPGPQLDRSTSLPATFPSGNFSTPSSASPSSVEQVGDSVWDRVFKSDAAESPGKLEKPGDDAPTVFGWYNPID